MNLNPNITKKGAAIAFFIFILIAIPALVITNIFLAYNNQVQDLKRQNDFLVSNINAKISYIDQLKSQPTLTPTPSLDENKTCTLDQIKNEFDESDEISKRYFFIEKYNPYNSIKNNCSIYVTQEIEKNLSIGQFSKTIPYKDSSFITLYLSGDNNKRVIVLSIVDIFSKKEEVLSRLNVEKLTIPGQINLYNDQYITSSLAYNDTLVFELTHFPTDCSTDADCSEIAQVILNGCKNDYGVYTYDLVSKKLEKVSMPPSCSLN